MLDLTFITPNDLDAGFDSFNDMSEEGKSLWTKPNFGHRCGRLLTQLISDLASDPMFSGTARRGTLVVGRIYDSFGTLIGESQSFADAGGNWMMNFFEVDSKDHARIEFEELAGSSKTFDPYADPCGYLGLTNAAMSMCRSNLGRTMTRPSPFLL